MISQRRLTYASHMDFDSVTFLYVYFDPKHSKGKSST